MSASIRLEYEGEGLSDAELAATPWQQARQWVDQAQARQDERGDVPEPLALCVATVDPKGRPDVRTVLMRFFDPAGPGFVTSLDSPKARQLGASPHLAASLTWPAMFRSIRFRGTVEPVSRQEVTDYFRQRPWGARISAWASRQSEPVSSRTELEDAFERYAARWPDRGRPDDVPVPERWGGYRVACEEVEVWAGRRNRLHDRFRYRRVGAGRLDEAQAWQVQRLQP